MYFMHFYKYARVFFYGNFIIQILLRLSLSPLRSLLFSLSLPSFYNDVIYTYIFYRKQRRKARGSLKVPAELEKISSIKISPASKRLNEGQFGSLAIQSVSFLFLSLLPSPLDVAVR